MIKINLDRAKQITHEARREARTREFAPHDEIIQKQIPGRDHDQAEQSRAEIRARYADMQTRVDQADNIETLKEIIDTCHN